MKTDNSNDYFVLLYRESDINHIIAIRIMKNFLSFLNKIKVFAGFFVVVQILVGYLVVISYPDLFSIDMAPIFASILNIALSAYLTFYISKFGFIKDSEQNNRKMAKIAIRNIRNNSKQLGDLIIKCDRIIINGGPITKETLENIREQMESLLGLTINSEQDFRDLVNDEYEQESKIMDQILESRAKQIEKVDEIRKLQLELEKVKAESNNKNKVSQDKVERMENTIKEVLVQIESLRKKESVIANQFPFGWPNVKLDNNRLLYVDDPLIDGYINNDFTIQALSAYNDSNIKRRNKIISAPILPENKDNKK
ncbi:MAG: hypothetical protein RBQ97_09730 [Acholeplasma sp.]|nr:hypothetical protein [Acholeplasma sp.]